jgi:alpha-tubulin suppressor-like RCC1 family protein
LFGDNSEGQLGNNTIVNNISALQTVMTGPIWKQISENYQFQSAAIRFDNTLWMWGDNSTGDLGLNDTVNRSSPCQVFGGGSWSSVAGGYNHTAGIKSDGTLWLWGRNTFGNLGNNNDINSSTPVQEITGSTNWTYVSCGNEFTLAIKNSIAYGWGVAYLGNLANNLSPTQISSPIQITATGQSYIQAIAGFDTSAFIKSDNTLWVVGANTYGELGISSVVNYSSIIQVGSSANWSKVSLLYYSVAAIKSDGTLWTWGLNSFGQLGNNSVINQSSPIQIAQGTSDWSQVAGGGTYVAALKNNGSLWIWGQNFAGTLGNIGSDQNKSVPVQVNAWNYQWASLSLGRLTTSLLTKQQDLPTTTPSPSASVSPTPTPTSTPTPTPTPT